MSIFMRECLLRHHCHYQSSKALQVFLPLKSAQKPRFVSYKFFEKPKAVKKVPKKSRQAPSARPSPPRLNPSSITTKTPTSKPSVEYQSYASRLAKLSHTTLLYQAPSHTLFIFACYSGGVFCWAYAAVSFYSNYLTPPDDLSKWVPYAFGVICFMMGGMGGWLALGPSGLVRSITAIPRSLSRTPPLRIQHQKGVQAVQAGAQSAPGATATPGAALQNAQPELQIEVELRKMFPVPFFPARKIYARPEEIVLRYPLAAPLLSRMTPEQVRAVKAEEERAAAEALEYERSHLMTAPFRHMSRAFYKLFLEARRSFSREGFLKVEVKGVQYKIDITGGWALDGGRALDRLAVIRPKH